MLIDYHTMSIGGSGREVHIHPIPSPPALNFNVRSIANFSWTAHYKYDPFDHRYPYGYFEGFIDEIATTIWSVDNGKSYCKIRWSVLATPNRLLVRPKKSKKIPPVIIDPPSETPEIPTNSENPELPSPNPPTVYTPCLCVGYAPTVQSSPLSQSAPSDEPVIGSACDCSGNTDDSEEEPEPPCGEDGDTNPAETEEPVQDEEPPAEGECEAPAENMDPAGVIALPQPLPEDIGPVVAAGSDVDNDGKTDLIIGTPTANDSANKLKKAGSVTVINSETLKRLNTLHGEQANANFAAEILVYDINNDGQLEIIVTAPLFDDKSKKLKDSGAVFIYDLNLHEIKRFYGKTSNERLGSSIIVGDINNDQQMDLIVGAPNANHPTNGAKGAGKVIAYDGNSHIELTEYYGDIKGAAFGSAISVGHVNGDSYLDLLVGAPLETKDQFKKAGSISVIFGNNARPIVKKYGQVINANLGHSVQLGDLNGDGYADIIASAPNDTRLQPTKLTKAGSVWAWSGKEMDHPLVNTMPIYGTAKNMRFGIKVYRTYWDADNHMDLLVQLGINDALTPIYGASLQ